ncbi:acyltransferase [Rhizobium sp. P32RR-XVIII]|uniref:acyltransferase family protein n=1 Tax=Rhizobium sp. P32RR-XVIII TaxID=2726738 RepID=UPI0014572C21|nr:acyltransferase [Rhizobium sp. P32RR-XVIII]NLS08117.1 acyltransferase [Rhizobium sp. P32RR-XVIII]
MHPRNSFDALRLLAALLVFHTHHYVLNGIHERNLPWIGTAYSGAGVGMFFAISGYLVTKSANRDPAIWSFLWKRALRIMPGLTVNILFTVALGACLTTLTLSEYLTSTVTHKYIYRNILIAFQEPFYELPGLFKDNPAYGVNGSLWTLPYEISFYFVVGLVFFCTRSLAIRAAAISLGLLTSFILMMTRIYFPETNFPFHIWNWIATRPLAAPGIMFFFGAATAMVSISKPLNSIIGPTVAICFFLLWGDTSIVSAYVALAAATILIGESKLFPLPKRLGDMSYGIYLYAFPIQQAFIQAIGTGHFLLSYALSLTATVALAAVSWRFVERPTLRLKGLRYRRYDAAAVPAE